MIGTEALGKRLTAPRLVEHTADADAVDMCRFNTESYDPAGEDIHDDHHPETLQQDGLASKQIDAPQAVACFSNNGEPRRAFSSRLWERVAGKNPAHHVLVDLQPEGERNLLRDARATGGSRAALNICGGQG